MNSGRGLEIFFLVMFLFVVFMFDRLLGVVGRGNRLECFFLGSFIYCKIFLLRCFVVVRRFCFRRSSVGRFLESGVSGVYLVFSRFKIIEVRFCGGEEGVFLFYFVLFRNF